MIKIEMFLTNEMLETLNQGADICDVVEGEYELTIIPPDAEEL